jgi:ADP-heptose:LPS heptosyltransferase
MAGKMARPKRVPASDLSAKTQRIENFCGELSLRQSAALVAKSDFVITNSSLPMHLSGAFHVPSMTLLGEWYDSAELHHRQWGYPESIVLGKEILANKRNVPGAEETWEKIISRNLLS